MEVAAAKLMDFSQPMDVPLLDQVVTTAFDASNPQVSQRLVEQECYDIHHGDSGSARQFAFRNVE